MVIQFLTFILMINIFQYLEKTKGKPIPFLFKLLNNIPLNENELIYNNDLDLSYSKITYLPDNLTVNGHLWLYKTKIKCLPNNLTVNGWLDLEKTKIKSLPNNLTVNDDLYCYRTPLANNIKNDKSLLTKHQKQVKGKIYHA